MSLRKGIHQRLQHGLACDHDFRCFHLVVGLRVITNVREEDASGLFDEKKTSTAGKAAKVSDIRQMADEQSVETGRREMLAKRNLARNVVHPRSVSALRLGARRRASQSKESCRRHR